MALSVRSEYHQSAVVQHAQRAHRLIAQVEARLSHRPVPATILFQNVSVVDQWSLSFGDALKVELRDPSLVVIFDPAVLPTNRAARAPVSSFVEQGGQLIRRR